MAYAIETRLLMWAYRRQQVLQGIDLQVPQGSIYGYLGRNGAGKTSTIKLLTGLMPAARNTVFFDNQEFVTHRENILRRVGALIGDPSFYNLTAWENLRALDCIYRCGRARIMEMLRITGLEHDKEKPVRQFSTGMKQRLGIAAALLHNPDIVILDEPMNGLDPEGIFEVRELLLQLRGEGKTIFFSSHILDEMEKICTHVGILEEGKIIYQGPLGELLRSVPKQLEIVCNTPDALVELLISKGMIATRSGEHKLSVALASGQTCNRLIDLLAATGVEIYGIESSNSSLENIYLNLTARA